MANSATCFEILKRYEPSVDGYVRVRLSDGRVIEEHRLVMAAALGRELSRCEIVRHLDKNNANNTLSNLMLDRRGETDENNRLAPRRVALVCAACTSPFERRASEVNAALARGKTRFYCGRACVGRSFGRQKLEADYSAPGESSAPGGASGGSSP